MKKFINLTAIVLLVCMLATMVCACSGKNENEAIIDENVEAEVTTTVEETTTAATSAATEEATVATTADTATEATTAATEAVTTNIITDEMAYDAIRNRCISENPDNAELDPEHWYIISSDDNEVVVFFLAYTGAEIRYYIDRTTGDTHVTELVPGIFDEEQDSDETFNAWDYITAEIYR